MGLTNIAGYLAGGMTSWREEKRPVERVPRLSVEELHERWNGGSNGLQLLDVRERSEWDAGHIPGSTTPPTTTSTSCRTGSTPGSRWR